MCIFAAIFALVYFYPIVLTTIHSMYSICCITSSCTYITLSLAALVLERGIFSPDTFSRHSRNSHLHNDRRTIILIRNTHVLDNYDDLGWPTDAQTYGRMSHAKMFEEKRSTKLTAISTQRPLIARLTHRLNEVHYIIHETVNLNVITTIVLRCFARRFKNSTTHDG